MVVLRFEPEADYVDESSDILGSRPLPLIGNMRSIGFQNPYLQPPVESI